MANGNGSRVSVRSRFTATARLRLIENDLDKIDSQFDVLKAKIDERFDEVRGDMRRIFWTLASLGVTIIGGLAVAVATT